MNTVGIRELKNRLSEYVRRVRAGEAVLVTDRGRVVAELRGAGSSAGDAPDASLARLARDGRARIGAPNRAGLYPVRSRGLARGSVADLLQAERSER